MTPPTTTIARNKTTTKPAAPAPLSNEQLGEISARYSAADKNVTDLKSKLARIDQALADPKHADKKAKLNELRTRYSGELKQESKKLDVAKKQLDEAFAQTTGTAGGPARNRVEKMYARLEAVEKELAAANKRLQEEVPKFKAAVDALQAAGKKYGLLSPQFTAAEKKAVALKKAVDKIDQTIASLQSAQVAVSRGVQDLEDKAFAEAKKAGDPTVQDVVDVRDFASNNRVQQVKVLGAPVVGVTADQAVEADLGRIALAAKSGAHADDGAARGARALETQLSYAKPDHQRALVDAAVQNNLIGNMALRAQTNPQVTAPVLDAIKRAQGRAQDQLGLELAKATHTMHSAAVRMLDARMKKGDGFEEAYALERGLRHAGKTALAAELSKLMRTRLDALTDDFREKSTALAKTRGELARLVAGFGPLLPGDKQQAAVDAFKARHAQEFGAWEAAGAKLARASKFIIEHASWNEKAAELLPDALTTKTGQNLVLAALKAQSQGIKTFLDAGPEAVKDATKIGKTLPTLVLKSIAGEALRLAATGRHDEALKFLDKIKSNAGLFGLKADSLDETVHHLKDIMAGKPGAVQAFDQELRHLKPDAATVTALKAVAWAASIASGIDRLKNHDDLYNVVKGTGEILGPTSEMAAMALEMVANSQHARVAAFGTNGAMLTKAAGGAFMALGAVLDGISAVKSFRNGELIDGGASTASAIGGAILAIDAIGVAAGMQVIPVWGQIAGAALIIGGTIAKWVNAERKAAKAEKAMEDDAQAYLEAAGIDRARADELSDLKRSDGRNVGMMIQQLAPALGMKPKELWDKIVKMSPDRIDDFVDMTKDLVLVDGKIATSRQGDTDTAKMESKYIAVDPGKPGYREIKYYPKSLSTAAEWTREFLAQKD